MAQRAPGATHESGSGNNINNWSIGITSDGSSIAHVTFPLSLCVLSNASTTGLLKLPRLKDTKKKSIGPTLKLHDCDYWVTGVTGLLIGSINVNYSYTHVSGSTLHSSRLLVYKFSAL